MQEDGYRAFLERRGLGQTSISSYLSNGRYIERLLNLDLDTCDLTEHGVSNLKSELARGRHTSGITYARLADTMTAVRRYAEFRDKQDARLSFESRHSGPDTTHDAGPVSEAVFERRTQNIRELLADYRRTLDAMRANGVLRTGNSVLGDYAERLFADAFGWTLERNSQAGYDAIDAAGCRFQIKARRLSHAQGTRQLGAFRRLPDRSFDTLAAVLFNTDFEVEQAILVPYALVAERAIYAQHTNSWRFILDPSIWNLPGTRDVTEALRLAAAIMGNDVSSARVVAAAPLIAFGARWSSTLARLFASIERAQNE